MGQDTTVIAERRFFRQESAPQQAPDGATWVTESDGAGNDTVSRYQYNAAGGVWELNSAVGPSEPNAGTNVPGATWRDTSTGTPKQYDGSEFIQFSSGLKEIASGSTETIQPGETITVSIPTDLREKYVLAVTGTQKITVQYGDREFYVTNEDSQLGAGCQYTVYTP